MSHDAMIRYVEEYMEGYDLSHYYVDCSCGFKGPHRDYKSQSKIDMENHYKEAGE